MTLKYRYKKNFFDNLNMNQYTLQKNPKRQSHLSTEKYVELNENLAILPVSTNDGSCYLEAGINNNNLSTNGDTPKSSNKNENILERNYILRRIFIFLYYISSFFALYTLLFRFKLMLVFPSEIPVVLIFCALLFVDWLLLMCYLNQLFSKNICLLFERFVFCYHALILLITMPNYFIKNQWQ